MIKSLSFLFAAFCAMGIPHLQPQKSNVQKNVLPEEIIVPSAPASGTYVPGDGGFLKRNFATYYFNNCVDNYGYNKFGSCSYVACELLLNFYDTYWNDRFVENQYEENADTTSVNGRVKDVTTSPGSHHESWPSASDETAYRAYVQSTKDTYLHTALLDIGINQFDVIHYVDGHMSVGTFLTTMKNILNIYFDGLPNLSRNDVTITVMEDDNNSQTTLKNKVKELVQAGTPVVIDGAKPDWTSAHSYVAYDYDETTDDIYCNKGHQSQYSTHMTFNDMGFTHIQEILYFEPVIQHQHTNNYYINEADGTRYFCPCSQLIPQDLYALETLYLDELPSFKWEVLIDDHYLDYFNASYTVSVLNRYQTELYVIEDITDDEITLTREQYDTILSDANCSTFYIHVQFINPNDYVDDYYVIKSYSKPYTFKYKTQIKPNEWGFEQRYYFLNEGIRTTTLTKGDLTVTTSRLRCGYIQNSYVVLSPRRANAGRAYFEMNFSQPIIAFSYSVCLWSANENLDGSAFLQIKDENGNWITIQNLLSLNLTTKEQGIKRYKYMNYDWTFQNLSLTFDIDRIYGIRFEATATAVGSNNKGRLCIDDLVFNTSNPTGLLDGLVQVTDFASWPLVYPKTRP